jgi:hypothetical protein
LELESTQGCGNGFDDSFDVEPPLGSRHLPPQLRADPEQPDRDGFDERKLSPPRGDRKPGR